MVAAAANDPGLLAACSLPGPFASLPTLTQTDSYRATSAHARR